MSYSKPCRDCHEPIGWAKIDGRNRPVNADGVDHGTTCLARAGQVPDRLKFPTEHHISAWKINAFESCQQAYYWSVVEGVEVDDETEAKDVGSLVHSAIEGVVVRRHKAKDMLSPVTPAELRASLDAVLLTARWDAGSLMRAVEILEGAASRIDLSCLAVDEHGPVAERRFSLAVGGGVIVGGIVDAMELIGSDLVVVRDWKTGLFRDPYPRQSPAVGLYAAHAHALYPEREVIVVLDYLALDGEPDEVRWTPSLEEGAKALARAVVTKTRIKGEDKGAWPATFGSHCSRCPFTARCETFQGAMSGHAFGNPQTLEELVPAIRRMADVSAVATKLAKAWRDKAKPLAAERADRFGRLEVAGHKVKLSDRSRSAYWVEASRWQQLDVKRADEPEDEMLPGAGDSTFPPTLPPPRVALLEDAAWSAKPQTDASTAATPSTATTGAGTEPTATPTTTKTGAPSGSAPRSRRKKASDS